MVGVALRKLGPVDVVKKATVKRGVKRCLFSFPGLFAPLAVPGATMGVIDRLDTRNPVLYVPPRSATSPFLPVNSHGLY